MNIFKVKSWGLYKACVDLKNYVDFIKTMKKERNDVNSKFNKWNLKLNYFYNIYFTYDMDDTEANLPENVKKLRLVESLAPLHLYLDEDLGFAECLVPEINQFYNDKNEATLTYLIIYRFAFNKLSIGWLVKWSVIISLLISAGWMWGNDVIEIMSNLLK